MQTAATTTADDLQHALEVLRAGGVILYPTDTIWGIGCDAACSEAVRRIYRLKQRDDSKAMLLLVDSLDMLSRHVKAVPESVPDMAARASRPTTMVLDGAQGLAPELLAPDGSAGFRISRDQFSASLCRMLGRPVVSTSANISGAPSAPHFKDITPYIIDGVDYACTTRRDDMSAASPSRVIKIDSQNNITVLRD